MTRTAGCKEPFDVVEEGTTRQLPVGNRFLSCAAAGCLAVSLCVAPARADGADPSGVRLVWEAGAGTETCLARAELERLVDVELERAVFVNDEGAAARVIRVRLERDEKGDFRALVTRERASDDSAAPQAVPAAPREVTARECREIDEPLALVVALLADADEAPPEPPVEKKDEPPPPPEPAPPPDKRDEIQPLGPVTTAPGWEAAQRDARFRYEADVAGATGLGVLPHVGVGAELGFLAEPPTLPAFRLRVLGLVSQPAEPVPGATVSFAYAMSGLSVCPNIVRFPRVTVRFCLGADLGALYARSTGLEDAQATTEFFGQFDLTLRGAIELGNGVFGILGVGVVLPTHVDSFVYHQGNETIEIFQMAFMPFLATAGVAYEFL